MLINYWHVIFKQRQNEELSIHESMHWLGAKAGGCAKTTGGNSWKTANTSKVSQCLRSEFLLLPSSRVPTMFGQTHFGFS